MKKKWFLLMLLTVVIKPAVAVDRLYEGFQDPPAQARPFVRWWWNGNCVTEKEILRELDVLKDAGVGGVEINPIAMPEGSTKTQAKALKWLSPEWKRMVKAASEAAKRRGMIADLIVGSGWPFGGQFLKPGETIQRVGLNKKMLEGPGVFNGNTKDLLRPPKTYRKRKNTAQPRLLFLRMVPQNARDINSCIDLMDKVKPDGTVRFEIPAGRHTLYVGAWQQDFRSVMYGAPGADGPVLDHYNKDVVEKYLQRMSESLGSVMGGQLGDGLRAMFCDSIELSGANWTSDFLEEFERRRGYLLESYLPFVLDRKGPKGNTPFADTIRRARYDFNKTLVELFYERFILTFNEWCHRNGTLSRYQAYGTPFLMGMLDGYMVPDIPEGDTWIFYRGGQVGKPMDGIRYAVWNKYASSAAHLTGKRLVGCEAITNTGGVFRTTLEHIKQAGDLNFITGVNHTVLHGFNYSPPEAGFPGWIRYGTYFSEQNPWWPYFRKWADYNARLSWVFQQTGPGVQVAIFGPTADVWGRHGLERDQFINMPWYLHQLWQPVHQNGYSADYVNAAVLQGATFEDGKLRFGPMAYEVLILADVESLEPETAKVIERFARAGGRIIFVGRAPDRSPSLKDAYKNDQVVSDAIKAALKIDPKRVASVPAPERGALLEWAGATLAKFGIRPAVEISSPDPRLFQIHHRFNERDVFFFTNLHRQRSISFQARFATGDKTPWRWDAETGVRTVFPQTGQKNKLEICLEPLESLLLVFEPEMSGEPQRQPMVDWDSFIEIDSPWQLTLNPIQGEPVSRSLAKLVNLGSSKDTQLNTFGGTAVYHTEFDVVDTQHTMLSLGQVYDVSQVTLNGKSLGVRWWGRHIYDIGDALQSGKNVLDIRVTTVLSNYCRSLKNNPTAYIWTRNREPVSAGLVGPVRLLKAKE